MAKRKPSRSKTPDSTHRSKHLTITLTPDERVLIDQAAQKNGTTASSWGRHKLVKIAKAFVDSGKDITGD